MEKDLHNIDPDNLFRGALEPLETEPSPEFWNRAETSIADRVHRIQRKKLLRWKALSFSLAALLGISGIYIFYAGNEQAMIAERFEHSFLKKELPTVEAPSVPAPVVSTDKPGFVPVTIQHTDLVTPLVADNPAPISTHEEDGPGEKAPGSNGEPVYLFTRVNTVPSQPVLTSDPPSFPFEHSVTGIPPLRHPRASRWQVLAYYSPTLTVKEMKDKDGMDSIYVYDVKKNEEEDRTWTAGIKAGYDICPKLTLVSGVYYHHNSIRFEPSTVEARKGSNGALNYALVSSNGTVEFVPSWMPVGPGDTVIVDDNSMQSISWVGMPLQVQYRMPVKRFTFYASAGAAMNVLVKGQTEIFLDASGTRIKEKVYSINGLRDVHYHLTAGLGVRFAPVRRMFLFAEPSYRRSVTPINTNTPVETKPNSWELALGMGWHF